MAAKQLVFSEEARRRLKSGVDIVANAVATTLGPKGRNVAVDRKFGSPTITHDGVTVAKEIELEDPFENMGAQLLKEAATKTNDIAGDGTTTSTVLAHAIVTEGLKNLAAGANPMLLQRGIAAAAKTVADHIKSQAIDITTKEDIANVASISAQDRTIGELIAEVMDRVGKDGVIQRPRVRAGIRRGYAVRSRLHFGLFRDRSGAYGSCHQRTVHPDPRQENLGCGGYCAGA